MAARNAASLGVLVLTLALAATPAHALTRAQATAKALAALKPEQVKSVTGVVVYGSERPIRAGHAVWGEKVPKGESPDVAQNVRPLKNAAWLFWMDPTWGAKFSHPTTLLLVDDKSGDVVRRSNLSYWPIIDGKDTPFVTWGRFQVRFQVFSSVPGGSTGQPLGTVGSAPTANLTRAVPAPIKVPKDALKGDCIITIGEGSDVKAKADFAAVNKLGKDLADAGTGLQHWKASSGKKYDDPDGENLAGNVRWAVGDKGCKDVMLFIDGHGTKKGNGPPGVYVGRKKWEKVGKNDDGTDRWESEAAMVTAEDIRKILDEFKTTTFKIKIDACFSGRIKDAIPQKTYKNVHVLEVSSSAKEVSYFYLDKVTKPDGTVVPSPTNNQGNQGQPGLSEFTNGNLSALRDFFTSQTLIDNAQQAGGALLAQALTYGARNSGRQDFAQQQGMTHPSFYTDQILEPPGGPKPTGGRQTLGSTLTPPADTSRNKPEDTDFYDVFFDYCALHPSDPLCVHGTTTQGRYVDPSGQGTMPADGQIVAIRVKGIALGSDASGAPPPLTEIHFSSLRPQADGSVQVVNTSQAFNLPSGGDPNQVTTYVPENFCVKAGDYLTLSTEGGFDATYYPQGVRYQVFGAVPGSKIAFYSKHNGVQNGAQFTGTAEAGVELLMQWDLATGDQATALCPGGTKTR